MSLAGELSDDARVHLLLCSSLALPRGEAVRPLGPVTWSRVATALASSGAAAGSLLGLDVGEIERVLGAAVAEPDRIARLLARSGQLAFELERLAGRGIGVTTLADDDYPPCIKDRIAQDRAAYQQQSLKWSACGRSSTKWSSWQTGSWRVASSRSSRLPRWTSMASMLEIRGVEPLEGRLVRLTLSDGEVVVRDLSDLLRGPLFDRLASDDEAFRRVSVNYGTLVWPDDVDMAPETLIWDGPTPADEESRRPQPFLRPQPPR